MMDQKTPRYIDADEFLQRALGTKCFRNDYALMLTELISESITFSPDEICGEAEWIKEETIMGTQYRCSNCDNADNKHTAIRGHYCWFCGAKMVRGGNDGKTNVQK